MIAWLLTFVGSQAFSASIVLTPDLALEMMLKNNPKVRLALLDFEIAQAEQISSHLDFDIHATAKTFYNRDRLLSNSIGEEFAPVTTSAGLSLGVKSKIRYGTEGEASLSFVRDTTDQVSTSVNKYWQSGTQFKITQPILRDRGAEVNTVREVAANVKSSRYLWDFLETVDQQGEATMIQYYEWLAYVQKIKIQKDKLSSAGWMMETEEAKYKAGKKSRTDVLQALAKLEAAKARLATLEREEIEAREKLGKSVSPLKEPLNLHNWTVPTLNKSAEAELAEKKNTKIIRLGFEIDEAQIEVRSAQLKILPRLDFIAGFSSSGLSINAGSAMRDAAVFKFPPWNVMFELEIPIGNEAARGEIRRTKALREKKEMTLTEAKSILQSDVDKKQNTLRFSRNILEVLENRLTKAKDIELAKKAFYLSGKISLLEYNDASDEVKSVEESRVDESLKSQKENASLAALNGKFSEKAKTYFSSIIPRSRSNVP
ncbi:MAG: TolC family protein [Bdellovibrionota bacterium]